MTTADEIATFRGLVAAIAASPDDDGPRLVLADWLVERGNPRGELINVQCLLARLDDGDERAPALRRRAKQLLEEHGTAWIPAALRSREAEMDRGFITSLWIQKPSELKALDLLGELAALVTHLRVSVSTRAALEALVPVLNRARRLTLSAGKRNVGLGALASLSIEELDLEDVAFGGADLGPVLAMKRLSAVVTRGCRFQRGVADALGRTTAPLSTIALPAAHLGEALGTALGSAPGCSKLKRLVIPGNELGGGLTSLLRSGRLDAAEELDLRGNELDDAAVDELTARRLSHLRRLSLGDNALTDDGVARIARADLRLSRLDLGAVSDRAAHTLAASATLAGLRSLVLAGAKLTAETEAALVASPHLALARIYVGTRQLARKKKPG